MEFNENLQKLRKERGLTQEALAERLFVSRAAISKWESGRGYPSIDSLRTIAQFFSVTVDELLSPREAIALAEENHKRTVMHLCDLVFGIVDICSLLLLFLPLFALRTSDAAYAVSLFSPDFDNICLQSSFVAVSVAAVIFGIATLSLQGCRSGLWIKSKFKISLLINIGAVLLFILSLNPYAAAFSFASLLIKGIMLIRRQ